VYNHYKSFLTRGWSLSPTPTAAHLTNEQQVALVALSCPEFYSCLHSAGQKVRQTIETEDTFEEEFEDTSTFEKKSGLLEVS
jgi:hypothetical protein